MNNTQDNMTCISEIIRIADIYFLPDDVFELILREIYRWDPPKVDIQGYVVSNVKNIRRCADDLVLENVTMRDRWLHIARLPFLHSYERRVCMWSHEYYDIKEGISGMSEWVETRYADISSRSYKFAVPLRTQIDRRSEEWIGFKSWIQMHPAFMENEFAYAGYGGSATSSKMLSKHWFKYELVLAYPTLYGKNGWAKKK